MPVVGPRNYRYGQQTDASDVANTDGISVFNFFRGQHDAFGNDPLLLAGSPLNREREQHWKLGNYFFLSHASLSELNRGK